MTLLFAGGAVWLFLAAIPVFADGGPHIANINSGMGGINADTCAGCHRAHTATASYLLIEELPAMCYACHGSTAPGSSTDVANGVQYTTVASLGTARGDTTIAGALRDGGFTNAHIGTGPTQVSRYRYGTSPYGPSLYGLVPGSTGAVAVTSSHIVDGATAGIVWGNGVLGSQNVGNVGPTAKLECTSCHNPHGNGFYRILNPAPDLKAATTGGTFYVATTGATTGVTDAPLPTLPGDTRNYTIHQTLGNATTGAGFMLYMSDVIAGTAPATRATSGDYFHRYVPFNGTTAATHMVDAPNAQPATFNTQMNAWCATCHTKLNAPSGAWNVDSGDANFHYRHPTRPDYPACTTCHVAHGSNAKMTGDAYNIEIIPGNTTYMSGDSSFLLKIDNRGVCQMCHDPTGSSTTGVWVGPPSPIIP